MILLIALKDLRERLRDGRIYWAGGIVAVLLMTALAVGYLHQQQAHAEQAAAQSTDYNDWLSQGARHPHDAAHQGMHVFKPDTALALLDPGINPYIGSTVWLQAHRQSEVKFRPAQDATGLQRFGDLSAAWILQALGPLLVIVLGFNAFSGEREQGTLRQTLSLGVSPWRLLWGKAVALAMSLSLLLVPAALAAIAVVWLAGGRADALLRPGVLSAGYAIYLTIFIFVTLGVSASARSSRLAITVLLALWIANTVVAPRVMAELSRSVFPSPTRLEFNQALQDDLKATSDRVWMQAFGTTERWSRDVPLNKWGLALKLDDESSYGVYDRHFGHLWDTWEHQQTVQESAGWLMPLLAMRALSAAMAGTDFAHHRSFTTAAEQQRRTIQNIVSTDLVAHADTQGHLHFSYQAGPSLWSRVPPFQYPLPTVGWAVHQAALSVLMLGCALLLSLAFAWRAVGRQTAL
ncbi:MAG: ABC transporter permease subunit [Bordetella sp.]|nr:ABC transporter permease subunit [Bordetella sp.]